MSNEAEIDRTLRKNSIKSFILRFDLGDGEIPIAEISEKMSAYFDRIERRQVSAFAIKFTEGQSGFNQETSSDFVLVSKNLSMTMSEMQKAVWLESSSYLNNSIYKEILERLISTIQGESDSVTAKRIGMRFINEYQCNSPKNISNIFDKRLSSILKSMTSEINQSRVICIEEYNNDEYKLRLQYGIPNKFYPARISVYDLLFDIDSYFDASCDTDSWSDVVREINHAAYGKFLESMNPKFLETLR